MGWGVSHLLKPYLHVLCLRLLWNSDDKEKAFDLTEK
jgi:hypothetical protein